MDFQLNEDQKMLRQTVADFIRKESPVSRLRVMRDNDAGWDPRVWQTMGELGWIAVSYPEAVGGLGGSFIESAIILEQFGHALVPEPYLSSAVVGGRAILFGGNSEQHARFLSPMLEGKASITLAHWERRSRFDIEPLGTVAEPTGSGWTLHGEKAFVLNGHAADHIVVSARLGRELAVFVIDREASGLSLQPLKLMDGHRAAHLRFEGVSVDTSQRLNVGDAALVIRRALDYGAAGTVAEGLGVCDRTLAMTTEYLNTREQFGVKIGVFQALQHRAVDMFVETELLRSVAMLVMATIDDEDASRREAAVNAAKFQLSESGQFVTRQALQLHGGIGVTEEHDIGLFFKRMHSLYTLFGDGSHHVERYANRPALTDPAL